MFVPCDGRRPPEGTKHPVTFAPFEIPLTIPAAAAGSCLVRPPALSDVKKRLETGRPAGSTDLLFCTLLLPRMSAFTHRRTKHTAASTFSSLPFSIPSLFPFFHTFKRYVHPQNMVTVIPAILSVPCQALSSPFRERRTTARISSSMQLPPFRPCLFPSQVSFLSFIHLKGMYIRKIWSR